MMWIASRNMSYKFLSVVLFLKIKVVAETVQNEVKEQKGGFVITLLGK